MVTNSWDSGSGQKNAFLNLTSNQPDIDKIYFYTRNLYKGKHQLLINKRGSEDINHFNDSNAFIEYSNDMDDIYKNIEEYDPN